MGLSRQMGDGPQPAQQQGITVRFLTPYGELLRERKWQQCNTCFTMFNQCLVSGLLEQGSRGHALVAMITNTEESFALMQDDEDDFAVFAEAVERVCRFKIEDGIAIELAIEIGLMR